MNKRDTVSGTIRTVYRKTDPEKNNLGFPTASATHQAILI